ncbi:peptide deformylase [Methylobacterium sp. HMF5984]|jgi:peptide deformylase|uniref:peptide deformylase n=1 Tax=unclassified Methylobacterium TaxID=2615210 RepID=UPI001FB9F92E|nr:MULTISPECIES: peptide deformylase [unclassified Methylobacterium]MCJ2008197.1 peptide deformylase [Methylobacterium sp. J-092]MCJ2112456.1 peptide deformylase [Methylobacterium sp. E-025]
MAARPLIFYPDPRLDVPSDPVTAFDADLGDLARDVTETLDSAAAAGLTAAHLGVRRRLVVLRPEPGGPAMVYVNPEIVDRSPERVTAREGSVSMPGVSEPVERAATIRVRFQDLDGVAQEEAAEGFRAACLQHEIDQLDGIFWIARLSRLRRERAVKRFAKLRAQP